MNAATPPQRYAAAPAMHHPRVKAHARDLPLRVGTRGSPLALLQTRLFLHLLTTFCPVLRGLDVFEEHAIRTTGDAVQDRRLADIGGKGLFAKEIHEALADGRIDFAVHSLKDLETELPPGIVLACTLQREDARDALILGPDCGAPDPSDPFACLAGRRGGRHRLGAAPGAASACAPGPARRHDPRQCADAAGQGGGRRVCRVAAGAGRACAGWGCRIVRPWCSTPTRWCRPPGRASSASPTRADDVELHELLAAIEDPEAKAVSTAERAMLAELDGSCRTPIGGHARLLPGGLLHLTGLVARADGSFLLKRSLHGGVQDAVRMGTELGASLRADSPRDIFA